MKIITHLIFMGLILPIATLAAVFSFNVSDEVIRVGDQFEVTVMMDTEGERVNAVQGTLVFPEHLLEAQSFDDGNSIINFWIEKPGINFAGAIPGGYSGKGKLFSVVFYAKSEGVASLNIKEALALLNDGRGTPAQLSMRTEKINISGLAPDESPRTVVRPEDKIPPVGFTPEISQNPVLFDGKYFLIFATQDKESGVDFYEVSEEKGALRWLFGPNRENFMKGESPYLLKDQSLESWIFIRAVDRAGNERLTILRPSNVFIGQRVLTIIFWIIVITLLVLGGWRVLGRKNRSG